MKSKGLLIAGMIGVAAGLAALASGCGGSKAGKETHFGEPFTQAPQVAIAQLLEAPDAYRRKPVRVTGTIERQCPAAGCWFFIRDGQGRSLKVELGDYFEKLPQNLGNEAEAEGEWIRQGEGHAFIGTRVTFRKKGTP